MVRASIFFNCFEKNAMSAFTRLLFAALLAVMAGYTSAVAAERVETIPTRTGITVKAIVNTEAGAAAPIVILFPGGDGLVKLDDWDGKRNPTSNFLVRTRKHFTRNGLLAAVPDAPSDRQSDGLGQWRTSAEHAADIAAVITHLRRYSKGPVFLIGTSRGTISAAGVAAQLPPGTVAGVILTATVTRTNRGGDKQRIEDAKLDNIRVPVLLAHHEDDACDVTPFSDLPALARKFVNAPSARIKGYTGGGNYRGSECGAISAHGFRDIERQVVDDLALWIKTVAAGGKP